MNQLANAVLALGRAHFAVEVLAADDVGGQLAPGRGHFAVVLLEQDLTVFALDGGGANLPLDGVERVGNVRGTENRVDHQPVGKATAGLLLDRRGRGPATCVAPVSCLGHEGILSSSIQKYTTIELSSAGRRASGYHS